MVQPAIEGSIKPPGRKRNAEKTRQSLLNSALKEFATQGYGGARIEKIARQARCNIRMLYHYFGNKKNLYQKVLESAYDEILEKEAQVNVDLEQPVEGVLALLQFVYDYFEANPLFEGLLRTENMMQGKFVLRSKHVAEAAFPLRRVIADLVESGKAKGIFREDLDPVQLYVTILSISRFHLANAYSLSALLDTDLTNLDWRKARFAHARDLLLAYLHSQQTSEAAPAAVKARA